MTNDAFMRLNLMRVRVLLLWAAAPALLVCGVLCFTVGQVELMLLCFAGAGISAFFAVRTRVRHRERFMQEIVLPELEKVFERPNVCHIAGIPSAAIRRTNLIRRGNVYKMEDYITGAYRDVRFEQCDLHVYYAPRHRHMREHFAGGADRCYVTGIDEYEVRIEPRPEYRFYTHSFKGFIDYLIYGGTCFRGRWMIFDFPEGMKIPPARSLWNAREQLDCDLISGVLGSRLHVGVENRKNAFKLPIFRSLRRKETLDRIQKDISLIRVVIDSALDYVPDEPENVNS